MADADKMTLGQIVDFCVAYNARQEQTEKRQRAEEKKNARGRKRKATQADINAWFG